MIVWSVGEVLWDVFPDHESFGGAPLNLCANLNRLGDQATLFSAVGTDNRGRLALEKMHSLGLDTADIAQVTDLPTGVAAISHGANGEPSFVIPRPAAFDRIATGPGIFARAAAAHIDWLYFGTLLQIEPAIEQFTTELAKHLPATRCFYDMNLRTGHWTLDLVERLSHLASVLKLNEVEAETLFELTRTTPTPYSLEDFCARWSKTYGIDVICVTLGPAGCLVYDRKAGDRGTVYKIPGYKVTVCDTVGSGDAFAAAFLHGYHLGWPMEETARYANALGALVASRAGATPEWAEAEVLALSGQTNLRSGSAPGL